jgi:hypothetical protein
MRDLDRFRKTLQRLAQRVAGVQPGAAMVAGFHTAEAGLESAVAAAPVDAADRRSLVNTTTWVPYFMIDGTEVDANGEPLN